MRVSMLRQLGMLQDVRGLGDPMPYATRFLFSDATSDAVAAAEEEDAAMAASISPATYQADQRAHPTYPLINDRTNAEILPPLNPFKTHLLQIAQGVATGLLIYWITRMLRPADEPKPPRHAEMPTTLIKRGY